MIYLENQDQIWPENSTQLQSSEDISQKKANK